MPAEPRDLLLAEMVVQMGFAARATVDEALSALEHAGPGMTLARVLLDGGKVKPEQMALVEKFMEREPEKLPGDSTEEEKSFGNLVEMKRLAATGEVESALKMLDALRGDGKYSRLGGILMRKTMLTAAEIHQVLAEKGIRILRCRGCSKKAEVEGYEEKTAYKCSKCGSIMGPVSLDEIPVADPGMDVLVVEEED